MKDGQRRALRRLVNAAVHFVAQSVVHGELRRSLPRILKIKVVGFAPHSRFVELVADRRDAGRGT